MHKKGIVITNAILQAERNEALFNEALDFVMPYDIDLIEFYTDEANASNYGRAIKERNYMSMFITAMDQRRNSDCRICSEDEAQRRRSVDFTKRSIEKAISAGAQRTIIQSGVYPQNPLDEVRCMHAVEKSLRELSEFAADAIVLQLEPCDRSVQICQLLGPTLQVYTLMETLKLSNIGLTMDVAHITELFENPIEAIRLCKPFCDHVHIANCVLDTTSALFGDKHPLFSVEKGCYSTEQGCRIYQETEALYANEQLCISAEMMGHNSEPMPFLKRLIENMPWFFKRRETLA